MPAISQEAIQDRCKNEPWCRASHNHVSFGSVPAWLENIASFMPKGSEEQKDYQAAAILATEIYRQQALKELNPADVDMLCKNEPWTTAQSVDRLDNGVFGFVAEKLEKAHDLFDKDAPEYTAYNEAFRLAKDIYFLSIHQYAKNYAVGKSRAQIEEINSLLWSKAHKFEADGTYKSVRLVRLCELMADYQRGMKAPQSVPSTDRDQIKASANSFWETGPF